MPHNQKNEQVSTIPTQNVTASTPESNPQIQPKRVSKPLGSSNGSSFSLNMIVNDKKTGTNIEDEVIGDNLPNDDYTIEQVQQFWTKFLDRLKMEHSIPAYNALATTTISLKDQNIIELEFISASSEAEYDMYKSRIINGLRNAINNFYFKIEVVLSQAEAKSHILTTKQKFEAFVEKNPTILKLKEEFGLDLFE